MVIVTTSGLTKSWELCTNRFSTPSISISLVCILFCSHNFRHRKLVHCHACDLWGPGKDRCQSRVTQKAKLIQFLPLYNTQKSRTWSLVQTVVNTFQGILSLLPPLYKNEVFLFVVIFKIEDKLRKNTKMKKLLLTQTSDRHFRHL